MGYKNSDWKCQICESKKEEMIWVEFGDPVPRKLISYCEYCDKETSHNKVFPIPARYMGEAPANFDVYGGQFDTMGYRTPPKLPDMPGLDEYQNKLQNYAKTLPDMPIKDMHQEMATKFKGEGPRLADYAEHVRSGEYREVKSEYDKTISENAEKRVRGEAIKRGENINMRKDKCKGDPDITG